MPLSYITNGIRIDSGGTLNVDGTNANPVIFTSYGDDSAGGDSNGNGSSSGAPGDYQTAVSVNAGAASISHAEFINGNQSINVSSYPYSTAGTVTVADSDIHDQVYIEEGDAGTVSMLRNQLGSESSTLPALEIVSTNPEGVVLSGSDENVFTGTGSSRTLYLAGGIAIPSTSTWSISGSSNAVVFSHGAQVSIDGELNLIQELFGKLNTLIH